MVLPFEKLCLFLIILILILKNVLHQEATTSISRILESRKEEKEISGVVVWVEGFRSREGIPLSRNHRDK